MRASVPGLILRNKEPPPRDRAIFRDEATARGPGGTATLPGPLLCLCYRHRMARTFLYRCTLKQQTAATRAAA